MNFKKKFKKINPAVLSRISTAIFLLLGLIVVNFWVPEKIFFMLFSAVMLLALWEWMQFVSQVRVIKLIGSLMISSIAVFFFLKISILTVMLLACLGWIYTIFCVIQSGSKIRAWWLLRFKFSRLLAGVWVLMPMWIGGSHLHSKVTHGPQWFFILLLIVMGTDIGGYIFGKFWGRVKLVPEISPGKTLEGYIGGLLFAQIFAWIGLISFGLIQIDWISILIWTGIIMCVSGFSMMGDLLESLFKRVSNLKDSGSILPGHGGILDRIDGITAALPMFWVFKLLV